MDAGGLAQMTPTFPTPNGLGGLASRRGGQNITPLTFDGRKQPDSNDTGVPTPRTSRSHLLAGLRTAPKSATATSFPSAGPTQQYARSSAVPNGRGQENLYNNAPKTAYPQYNGQQQSYQQSAAQQYTVEQVLAPPELTMDEQAHEQMDPGLYAQLVATNMFLAQQQQQLQQQLRSIQAAAQQFQQLNLNNPQLNQQQLAIYEQQQQIRNMQQQLSLQAAMSQGQQVYYNPATGQYFVDNNKPQVSVYDQQSMTLGYNAYQQNTPRVQVSPPPENHNLPFRSNSPPKRHESPAEVTPLPPPSANAFRRGHKKSSSLAPVNAAIASAATGSDALRSAGPKTASFPLTPMGAGYGPGQGRAGEHPIRQPRGPPSLDELKAKPTAKTEGSKNFSTRTRRSAVHNLVRAGLVRRKGTASSISTGSMSPVSETAEEAATPITDNESDSGRSGSGSLAGEECVSSRTSASGAWGAIGSDRPSSREKGRGSVDSNMSSGEADNSSFANVFKNGGASLRGVKSEESVGERKAPRLVLTSVDKRKNVQTS